MRTTATLCFSLLLTPVFASFPVETQRVVLNTDPDMFRLDTWGFIIGIFSWFLLPYSLVLLVIKKPNFRGSLAWGWLTGLVLFLLLVFVMILSFIGDEGGYITIY